MSTTAACRLPPGYDLHAFARVGSTNDEARRLADAGAPGGQVVWALEQTRGRGRHGRGWSSPPGNLYTSILLRPGGAAAAAAEVSLVAGVALAEALEELGPPELDLALKWPNDVLVRGAKVAGLLLESAARPDGTVDWVVLGTGVNLASCPKDTPYPASALGREGFAGVEPLYVLEAYVTALDRWLRVWRQDGFAPVRAAWLRRGYNLGGQVRLRLDRDELFGRFVDLTGRGALVLEDEQGRRREIAAGDLFYVGA